MRILYVFPEPLPLNKARAIQVINTVHSLAQQGVEITLAYVPAGSGSPDPFLAYGLERPANVTLLPISRRLPWPLSLLTTHSGKLFQWRLGRWLASRILQSGYPDAVLVRHVKLANFLIRRFPDLPLVYEAHEVFTESAPASKADRLARQERQVLQGASKVIAITSQLANRLKSRYGIDRFMEIIPSATSISVVNPEKDWAQSSRHIVYAGSLYGWKGAQDLVMAARWLPGCRVTLLGGDEKSIAALRGMVSGEGAEVEFLGHKSHREVQEFLGSACIAVLPNRSGSVSDFTSPLKLFEYMAAGCAIVVSDLPVFREVLAEHEAAWFVEGSPESLASAIRDLVQDKEKLRLLGRAMAEKAKQFSWSARATRLIGILSECVAPKDEVVRVR